MGTLTSVLTGVGSAIGVSSTTIKDDGTVDRDKRNNIISTLVAGTATTMAGGISNAHGQREIFEKYSKSYIESMPDCELEAMLQKIDLLEAENENTPKTR